MQMPGTEKEPHVESTCGQCGYCVRGISSLTCPECGSDLRIVGILPPNYRRRLGPLGKSIVWTIGLAIAAVGLSILMLQTLLPFTQTAKTSRTIFLQAPYLNVTLQLFAEERLWQPRLMQHPPIHPDSISLWDKQHLTTMELNVTTGAYSYFTPAGQRVRAPSGFDETILANWLAVAGAKPADPRVLGLCHQTILAIDEISVGNANKFTPLLGPAGTQIGVAHPSFSFTVHDEPSPVVIVILSLLWIWVWIYGIRRINRRRARSVVASATTVGG